MRAGRSWPLALWALCLAGLAQAEEAKRGAWETVATGKVVVKTRSVPGTDIKEIWAEGDMEASVQDIQAAITDPDRYPKFMPYVAECRTFGKPLPDGGQHVYTRLDFGSLITSRDYVVRMYVDEAVAPDGSGEFRNRWVADPDAIPKRANSIRLRVNSGSWHVTPKGPGRSHVVYKFLVDPGGWVPSFAANIGNKKGVSDTFTAVETEAQRRGRLRLESAKR